MKNLFKGKLTYGVALAGFVWGAYLVVTGDTEQGMVTILAALGLVGVRRAIS